MARDHAPSSFTLNVHAAPDLIQAAFLRRAMSALERISGSASAKTLTDALAAATDVGSLARLLSRSDVVGSAVVDLDPLAPMLARNVEHRQKLLQLAGGALSAEEAGRTWGSPVRLSTNDGAPTPCSPFAREATGAIPPASSTREKFFPGSPTSSRASQLPDHGPRSISCWLPTPCSHGGTPLQVLEGGDRDRVLRLVRSSQGDGFA